MQGYKIVLLDEFVPDHLRGIVVGIDGMIVDDRIGQPLAIAHHVVVGRDDRWQAGVRLDHARSPFEGGVGRVELQSYMQESVTAGDEDLGAVSAAIERIDVPG